MFRNAAIIGVGQSAYTRRPEPGQTALHFMRDAVVAALKDAQLSAKDIQGLAVASFSLAPDAAVDLAWKLGLSLRWILQDTNGGSSAMNMLGHALRGVETGAAETILVLAGDATGLAGYAKVAANFNTVTQKHLAPLGHGGPNGVYALVASRQMKKYGLEKSDYGHIAVAQREWAAKNPHAVYRSPLTMEEYLAAPMVADPLSRYDCVPVIAGAQAMIVANPGRAPKGRPGVRVRAHRGSFNYDNQEGDGLATGISTFAKDLWRDAHVQPSDIDVASIYDDYPTMVLAQANDLGLVPDGDLARFCRVTIGEKRFPVNTWGGMLSAGQPGGFAGGLNGITEAVLQLQHRAGERQVKNARLAVATGYGMTMYRYGGTAAAAVLERVE
ncbi:thiolase family protein [Rhodoplanes sp. Z2-YC6860]|uniref:thiolase family protein n=1 Tax=Rhodoplanes sp. Z2-YC6860 TaxID=674703 RepID=UPI00078D0863|nr:thiolase family protein [Rhodoplanes sp. Z2-YC6860]AMN43829.1 acetyl-CoA acetyltransferase [Rhodoplanes sp. Z2-YC6860]